MVRTAHPRTKRKQLRLVTRLAQHYPEYFGYRQAQLETELNYAQQTDSEESGQEEAARQKAETKRQHRLEQWIARRRVSLGRDITDPASAAD